MNLDELSRRILFRLQGRVIRRKAQGKKRGNVLISYITLPYLNRTERTLNAHSNRWESIAMVEAFTKKGYDVDLIDIANTSFIPKKKYDFFVDNYHNMERLSLLLDSGCKKIFHATTSHWEFNNNAEAKRFDDLYVRRDVRLHPDRIMPPNRALELCDEVTLLGNDTTTRTYAHGGKPITQIHVSTTHKFESPENKDFAAARKNFIWFGGAGVIHKGLDLVVEAFAQMPQFSLTICGKLDGETDFKRVYEKELALPNIHIAGFMDPGSKEFKELCGHTLALVYPSCSEGQSGAVVLAMHAGLIPLISRESGVDVEEFGTIFKTNTIEEIKAAVLHLATQSKESLKAKAVAAWSYARAHHTREVFKETYDAFVDRLLSKHSVS